MTFNPRGFVPYRNLSGNLNGTTRTYRTRAKNIGHIFKGDLVVMVSTSAGPAVQPYVVATDGTTAGGGILGVAEGLYDANKKPLVFTQPTRGPYLTTLTDGYVDVNIDPHQTYLAVVNGTASAGLTGRFVTVATTVAGTAYGISPMGVDIAATVDAVGITVTVDGTPVDAQWPLYCLGVEPFEDEVTHDSLVNAYKGAHGGKVEVIITNQARSSFTNATMRIVS